MYFSFMDDENLSEEILDEGLEVGSVRSSHRLSNNMSRECFTHPHLWTTVREASYEPRTVKAGNSWDAALGFGKIGKIDKNSKTVITREKEFEDDLTGTNLQKDIKVLLHKAMRIRTFSDPNRVSKPEERSKVEKDSTNICIDLEVTMENVFGA